MRAPSLPHRPRGPVQYLNEILAAVGGAAISGLFLLGAALLSLLGKNRQSDVDMAAQQLAIATKIREQVTEDLREDMQKLREDLAARDGRIAELEQHVAHMENENRTLVALIREMLSVMEGHIGPATLDEISGLDVDDINEMLEGWA